MADANYYVDSTVGVSGDGSIGSPWKLMSNIDWGIVATSVAAGNTVYINLKRGSTWVGGPVLSVGASGAAGRPITFRPYGTTGAIPRFTTAANRSITTNANDYLDFFGISAQGFTCAAGSNEINIAYSIVENLLSDTGLFWLGLNGTVYNCNIVGNERGIYLNNAAATVIVRNSIIVGNKATTGGVWAAAGVLDVDYSLIAGNGDSTNELYTGTTLGANNIYEENPKWTAWPIGVGYFTVTVDDTGVISTSHTDHAVNIKDTCNLYGAKMTFFINGAQAQTYVTTAGDITNIQEIIDDAGGHEIGNHTTVHSPMSLTAYPNLLRITSTNTNPQVNLDIAGNQLILTCDEVPNQVIVAIGSGETIDDLLAAIGGTRSSPTGKGWTITRGYGGSTPSYMDWQTPLNSGNDSGGLQAAPYAVTLNEGRYYINIVDGELTWMTANLTAPYSADVVGYPYGNNDTAAQNWLLANGYQGARAYNTSPFANFLSSFNIFALNNYRSESPIWRDASEAVIRKRARHVYILAMVQGAAINVLTHSESVDITPTQLGYILDEFEQMGGEITYVTVGGLITAIKAGHSTSDNKTYTKSYPSVGNYNLLSGSPCINAGTAHSYATDILGNPISGNPDLGPYEFQPSAGWWFF